MASALRSTFLAALLGLHAPAPSHAESLPEMVARHESEIKKLNEAIQALQKNQPNFGSSATKPNSSECVPNYLGVGKIRMSADWFNLTGGGEIDSTKLILKFLRVGREQYKDYIQFASNSAELNNKKLFEGFEYKFKNANCDMTIAIEEINYTTASRSPDSFKYVDLILNYQ